MDVITASKQKYNYSQFKRKIKEKKKAFFVSLTQLPGPNPDLVIGTFAVPEHLMTFRGGALPLGKVADRLIGSQAH